MPKRRNLIKAALTAPAMAMPSALLLSGGDAAAGRAGRGGTLFALYTDWLSYEAEIGTTFPDLADAETSASERGVRWSECPVVRAVLARQDALFGAQRRALYALAASPGEGLDDIAVKLALWRRANMEMTARGFGESWDALVFSAYDDALALAGRTALAHPKDDAMRALIGEAREKC